MEPFQTGGKLFCTAAIWVSQLILLRGEKPFCFLAIEREGVRKQPFANIAAAQKCSHHVQSSNIYGRAQRTEIFPFLLTSLLFPNQM